MKKIVSFVFISILITVLALTAVHASDYPSWFPDDPETFEDFYGTNLERVADEAGLFTASEKSELTYLINQVREKYGYDLVIYTDTTNYGFGPYDETCAINFYRFNGYGLGAGRSGMIIYVNMDPEDRYFSVVGTGDVEARTYNYNETIRDKMQPYMASGQYYEAMKIGIELIDELYDTGKITEKKTIGDYLGYSAIASVVGLVAGLINQSKEKAKMRSVAYATYTNDYIVQNSFVLRDLREAFLYKNVTRAMIFNDNDRGGGGGGSSHSGMHSSGGGGNSFSGGSSRF